jgi:hypothetical protein
MSTQAELAKLSVHDFAQRFGQEVVPLNYRFAYFAAVPLSEEDLKDYLHEPVSALPQAVMAAFNRVRIYIVPYLEKPAEKREEVVTFDAPDQKHRAWAAQFRSDRDAVAVFAIRDREVADYHYSFYRAMAILVADHGAGEALEDYSALLRDELRSRVHGEVDGGGWQLKQDVLHRQSDPRRDTKLFRGYARQSFIDTLTLYLHGICCDIDVDTGPRQLPSRYLRKRLELFHEVYPPPQGYAVFPEELKP